MAVAFTLETLCCFILQFELGLQFSRCGYLFWSRAGALQPCAHCVVSELRFVGDQRGINLLLCYFTVVVHNKFGDHGQLSVHFKQ